MPIEPPHPTGAKDIMRSTSPFQRIPLIAGLALLCAPATLWAQAAAVDLTNPFYVGVTAGLSHVSNVYRVPNGAQAPIGAANSDWIYSAGVTGGVDMRLGREHLTADVSAQDNRYARNSELNNVSYTGKVGLDWSTVHDLSGNFSAGGSRALSNNLVGFGTAPIYGKNVETSTWASATARVGLVTRWTLEGVVNYNHRTESNAAYAFGDLTQTSYQLGPIWQPSDGLRLGVDLRHTIGNVPYYAQDYDPNENFQIVYVPQHFTRNDIDFTSSWQITGASSLDLRLSEGRQHHDGAAGQNFSGFTGQLGWTWQPTARLSLTTQVARDTGLASSFISFFSTSYASTTQDHLMTTVREYASYQYSGKLSFNASASASRGKYIIDQAGTTNVTDFPENDYAASLGAVWQYSRSTSVNCSVQRQWRTGAAQIYPYTANSIGCVGQFLIF